MLRSVTSCGNRPEHPAKLYRRHTRPYLYERKFGPKPDGQFLKSLAVARRRPLRRPLHRPSYPAYTAAKHGVIGVTKAGSRYAAQNIRINAVCPGHIETPMMERFTGGTAEGRAKVIAEEPVGRMGKPEEIAAAVLWLCSDAAAFVIGHAMGHRWRPNGTVNVIEAGHEQA